ncbi:MAG TPA: cytochrome c [Nitrospirota bacterium]
MKRLVLITGTVFCLAIGLVYAQETGQPAAGKNNVHSIELPVLPVELKPGPGMDKAATLCNICHSLDYITMQPPFPRAQWTATVNKMIKVMGAPISDEDAKTIITYLSANYGTGK